LRTLKLKLAAKLDSDVVKQILDSYFRIMIKEVRCFRDIVEKLPGGGLRALVGAPLTNEDHAQWECRSALLMRKQILTYAVY
jgi:adenylate cyclase